jgi:hypothetical protein
MRGVRVDLGWSCAPEFIWERRIKGLVAALRSSLTWMSCRPECLGCHQFPIRLRKQACEQRAPCTLALVVGDKVLADFNRNVMQAASLTVHRDVSEPGLRLQSMTRRE